MSIISRAAGVDVVGTAIRGDAGGDFVARLRGSVTCFDEVGIVVIPVVRDAVNGFVDCGPGEETSFSRAGGVSRLGEIGQGFSGTRDES